MYPDDLKYSTEHEWVRMDGNIAEIGVTVFAQDSLGDVVFIDLPDVGTEIGQFDKFGEIESVKAVSDLFSPVGGKIVATNPGAIENPETVNTDPYGSGWLIKIEVSDPAQLDALMDSETYESTLE
ncbi:MAG: glycine cleavage system protein GcvH [Chloroflexi bacterium]|nr:glycine cleavage system protein GcvH [Chloroflexota bacterium]MCH8113867.1 glycine cleavage system protein GcvH [Chloroflexota bacterium]MCI0775163.1 glycine cleavage system protein GcvH [Chloroflexota bacterium]MCI0804039.1 glycine cleavage system protein GcvH [Chloroflexota bacterium]MCI0809343.1 glycine cleavage system protein GcvH [Chloroflexota bacterium]